ncbi:Thermonuclease precursor [Rosistilla carotiformis]|uniref:Thermonuclease n=1 Tax=Rosistilla carotiformis TaxID=2528017 RepID=A0A518JU19_9BACT|nr:thermonuclease family protein [Rosistilla carotiformis]QDV69038.1 Thermonuclease precursor [Rosistilla carotiformis]
MKTVASIFSVLILAAFTLASPPRVLEELTGKVIGVTDGDTIAVLVNREPVKVRLEGIDAPESKQSFGTRSKQALSKMVFGKNVVVKKTGEDRYGRTLGVIMVGSVDINAKMIEDGWAWHYKNYNDEERLAKLEDEAREAKRGLWADPNPLAPWEYRTRQRTSNDPPATMFWLNSSSNTRHNQNCEYFKNTKRGRVCAPNDGKPCGICGG